MHLHEQSHAATLMALLLLRHVGADEAEKYLRVWQRMMLSWKTSQLTNPQEMGYGEVVFGRI
jgi:hypothetical protein